MATHSSILAWRIPGTEKPGGLLSMGWHRVGHNRNDLACMHALEKEMATHSCTLAWRIPGTEDPGGLLSYGVAQSQTLDTTEATQLQLQLSRVKVSAGLVLSEGWETRVFFRPLSLSCRQSSSLCFFASSSLFACLCVQFSRFHEDSCPVRLEPTPIF